MTDEEIRRVYNSFPPEQTMSFQEFKKQVRDLADPIKIQKDLAEIQMQKTVFNANKAQIDRKLN